LTKNVDIDEYVDYLKTLEDHWIKWISIQEPL
jgi:hypothetical protein